MIKYLLTAAFFLTVITLFPAKVVALSAQQKTIFDSGIYYFDTETSDTTSCSVLSSANSSGSLSTNVPAVWRNLILETAPKYPDVDPRIVAAVLWVENRGWPEYKTSGWGVSSAGAKGPWQFIDSTWVSLGTDGDGDGSKDPENPKDAVHAAFKHNIGSAGKPIATEGYTGNAEADFNTVVLHRNNSNLLAFAAKYNGSGAPDGVKLKDFSRNQNSDYVIMAYWILATDFSKGFNADSQQFVDAKTSGKANQSTASISSCPAGSGIVSTDGYSFPVAPQRKSQNGGVPSMSPLPCADPTKCHHDFVPPSSHAFDISRQPGGDSVVGTPVYAISDGTIAKLSPSYQGIVGCQHLQLESKDGYRYWYGHIQKVSVKENEPVSAGQQIAVVGERKCAEKSDPHLHIDRGSPKGVNGGSPESRDAGIVPLINSLFESLPD
ncbi:MAG: hypothetical protein UX30_C0001G0003 [Candidatus Saccharibacteria bacterium GW2011_GWA2_46_10]|nr:MAG: hypothetical protein UX30_C0001G0003 [Candidatus Saccharibacteria bacterium GW2011_GWA2_46_10]OGL36380.1 MAG: hypothetical protein A3F05_01375 [Candidatus Saccharibacteria bacterium RIFCSPHIGHO2_12_FULL_47_17]